MHGSHSHDSTPHRQQNMLATAVKK
jgi:hypothetical protein